MSNSQSTSSNSSSIPSSNSSSITSSNSFSDSYPSSCCKSPPSYSCSCKELTSQKITTTQLISENIHSDNLIITNHLDADSATFDTLVANNASFDTLNVNHLVHHSVTITGPYRYQITPKDHIIYVNTIGGAVHLILPATYITNKSIIIKDVSLIFGNGAVFNVYITSETGSKIEHYIISDKCHLLKCSNDGTYILNTSGGSVVYRYNRFNEPVWMLESQMIGNGRLNSSTHNTCK